MDMNSSWFFFIVPIFVFILIKTAMDNRAKSAREKLRVLEEALRAGNLDDQAKQDLMETLTGRNVKASPAPAPQPTQVGFLLKFIAFLGWTSLCLGVAFLILVNNFRGWEELEIAAVLLPCVGFGLVTYPFVIRELQSPQRHRAPSANANQRRA